jgi:hypothetical protein
MPILGAEDRVLELEPTSPVGITGKYTLEATDEAGVHETPPLLLAPDQVPTLSKGGLCLVAGLVIALASALMVRFERRKLT